MQATSTHPRWMGRVLLAAAVYNLAWGAFAVLAPELPFEWIGIEAPRYPDLWRCIGMIVGVYGVGYGIAAFHPFRHWPIVLVGLLGKVCGPLGYVWAATDGRLPWAGSWTLLTNDLIWWLPFSAILVGAWRDHRRRDREGVPPVTAALTLFKDQTGRSLLEASWSGPVLIVCLRHFGCTFCREALADVARVKDRILARGTSIVLVHQSSTDEARSLLLRHGVDDLPRVSDPERTLYKALGLGRGTLRQLLGWKVWWRGWKAGVIDGHGVGPLAGDGLQMPGAFLVHEGRVLRSYLHESAADRPDYEVLATPPERSRSGADVAACEAGPAPVEGACRTGALQGPRRAVPLQPGQLRR